MSLEGVVADANVLLSAIVGNAALEIFTHSELPVHVCQFNADEVSEYLPFMAQKYGLPTYLVDMQWSLLRIRIHPKSEYQSELAKALRAIKNRDPEDAHVLALAHRLKLPIWSSDKDLKGHGVECYPTARLLRLLSL